MEEHKVLDLVFWNQDLKRQNVLGRLIFSQSLENNNNYEIVVEKSKGNIEILYSKFNNDNIENKEYFVKLFFDRLGNNNVDFLYQKSSPEIKTLEEVEGVLKNLQNSIILLTAKSEPTFFFTGKDRKNDLKV